MTLTRRDLWYGLAVLAALWLAGAGSARAQDAVVKGRIVSDRGEPVVGANVFIEELRMSVSTSNDGRYTLLVPGARVRGQQVFLRVRGIGFKPASRQLTLSAGEQTVDLTLIYDINLLQAVVVTGVQEATEAVMTPFDVSTVSAAQMVVPAADPVTQLKGKVPGAQIVSSSGRPGTQASVLLRGPTMINAQGRSQEPLYIVDGIVINGNLPDLNPNDIESVEVVKGAAGSSLYGARAGNGVIQITTKSGRHAADGIKFSVRSEAGMSDIERDFGLARFHALITNETGLRFCEFVVGQPLCARTFDYATAVAQINNQPLDWAGNPPRLPLDPGATIPPTVPTISGSPLRERFQITPFPGTSYNAVAQTVDPHPHVENSVDMTGRFGGTTFYTSADQYAENGAIRFLQGARRYAFRANVDQLIGTDWTIAVRSQYSRSSADGLNQEAGGTAFFRLTRVPAIANVLATDTLGRLYIRPNLQQGGQQNENPLYSLQNTGRTDITNRFIGGVTVQYTPVDWMSLSGNFSYDSHRVTFSQINDKGFRTTGPTAAPTTNNGLIFRGASGDEALNTGVTALFKRNFTPELRTHYTLAFQFEDRTTDIETGQGNFLTFKGVTTLNNTQATGRTIASSATEIKQLGLSGGAGVEYKNRYILDATIRRDGSSLFGAGNRWATWGRVSGAWLLSREPWWPLEQVSLFKLHGSYGTAGGSPRFDAQYETFGIGTGGVPTLDRLGNRLLAPEVHKELELGTDIELLNRYALTVTYAKARIQDQILPAPVSLSTGFNNQWQNAGTLENKTWELSLNVPVIQQRDASWSMRFIYSRNRSVITELGVPPYFYGGGNQGNTTMFRAVQGERFGTIYGHRFVTNCSELPAPYSADCGGPTSSYQRNDEGFIVWVGAGNNVKDGITRNLWETSNAQGAFGVVENWGMPILVRQNGVASLVPLGNALPDFQFAVTQDISWRRFSLYALVDASIGQKVFDEGFHWAHLDFLSKDVDQNGKSVGTAKPIGYFWRANAADGFTGIGGYYDQLGPNNYSVEDASYAKLREVSLSYRIGPIGGRGDWAVSLIGRNLYTLTRYRGFDPEVGLAQGETNSGAINAVDDFTFPNLRSFTIAVRTSF
ncbi:MAG TPA: SusC/RagA family TonB-linked outer membrane protein [Gemmatimonadales bacterium]|nr:SusC/RagA family TonB-linked outer membrane protein [Gemmatimonadales bacterium]